MSIQMIKHEGKFVPAQKDKKGRWVPIKDAQLQYTKKGELGVVRAKKSDDKTQTQKKEGVKSKEEKVKKK